MVVVNARVDHGNRHALAGDALVVDLVDTGHDVRPVRLGAVAALLPCVHSPFGLPAGGRGSLDATALAADGVGAIDHSDGPDVLDCGQRGKLLGPLLGAVDILELDGDTVEQLRVEVQTSVIGRLRLGAERAGGLCLVSVQSVSCDAWIYVQHLPRTRQCRHRERRRS